MILGWIAALALHASLLGPELRRDGYAISPPAAFRMIEGGAFEGTKALTFAPRASKGQLSVALSDGTHEQSGLMAIAWREGRFQPSPSSREEFSTAVVIHFKDELGLRFALEKASWQAGRVEVLGTVRENHQLRYVLVAALAGGPRHAVVTFSFPSGDWEANRAVVEQSLNSFRTIQPAGLQMARNLVAMITAGAAAALLASIFIWRRKSRFYE